MPILNPTSGEDEKSFVSRFMADPEMAKDYPDQKQRVAIAYKHYADQHGQRAATAMPDDSWNGSNTQDQQTPPADEDLDPSMIEQASALIADGKVDIGAASAGILPTDLAITIPDASGVQIYPVVRGGRVSRDGLAKAAALAAKTGRTKIAASATKLIAAIDKPKQASLRASPSTQNDLRVDRESGTIFNCAVMTIGPAEGHGFDLDRTSLEQCAQLINAEPGGVGVKSRWTHPKQDGEGQMADDLGTVIGRVKNARVVGSSVRGDLVLGKHAEILPGIGDARSYLLSMAENDPAAFGLSAVFRFTVDPQMDGLGNITSVPARIDKMLAVDCVGRPAANRQGLLAAASVPNNTSTNAKDKRMFPQELKAYLVSKGLSADATDDAALAYLKAMSPTQKAECRSKMESLGITGKTNSGILAAIDEPDADAQATMATKEAERTAALSQQRNARTDAGDEFLAIEAKRVRQIKEMGALLLTGGMPEADQHTVVQLSVAEGDDVTKARARFLKTLAEKTKPVQGSVSVGDDLRTANLRETMVDAITMRMLAKQYDPITAKDKYANAIKHVALATDDRTKQFASLSMPRMCQRYLATLGLENAYMLDPIQISDLMGIRNLRKKDRKVAALAESTSDFSSITLDAFNKTLRVAYLDAKRTWMDWARRATAPDFKNINRVVLSESPSMISRNEAGEIKYVTLTDSKEVYALAEYIAGIKLTRRSIINDDLDAFARIPMLQANAAGRLEDDVAYAILTANANMADGGALFNTTAVTSSGGHANLAGSGAVITVASLQSAKAAMKKQKGLANAARLELEPAFLLVPTSIEETTDALLGSQFLIPTQSSTTAPAVNQGQKNPFYGKFKKIIGSTRLDDNSATAWYIMADYREGQIDTVEVCFLESEPEPVARQETEFDTEDVKFAIRHVVAAKAIDFRGLFSNPGA